MAAKELADHLLSVRFTILLVLLGLAVIGTVYAAASGIRDVAPEATGVPALFLRLFTIAPEQRVPPFFALVGFLAPLLGIAFGFDAVNSERAEGTLPRLLSQPIHRDDVINGKFTAGLAVISLILAAITVLVAGIGLVRLGIVPSAGEVARLLAWLVVAIIYVGFWLAFSTLLSVLVRRAATAALVAITAWLVLTLFFGLLVGLLADTLAPVPAQATAPELLRNAQLELSLARLSPNTLYEEATVVLLDPEVRTVGILLPQQIDRAVRSSLSFDQSLLLIWPQMVGLIALTIISFAVAYIVFMRQEVRA
ncbi:MAG: ABC transporter permease [Actinomycetota bacterium]|nr:ABC transporter permease [Actinomycetota bacterium]